MSVDFRADLHMHSSCSDGSDSPAELLRLAKTARLTGLSITDHDTIQAYTPALYADAAQMGLELLRGVEISSEWEGLTVHILAYGFTLRLQDFLSQVVEKRELRNQRILEKLKKRGIDLSYDALHKQDLTRIIGRPHIAAAIVKAGAAFSIADAFDRYLKDSAPCYVIGGKFSPHEVIDAIHRAEGKAIVAHPHLLRPGRFLNELLQLPFDGIECYYGLRLKTQEAPWLQIAKKRNWIATGGSDYHGAIRPHIPIGCSWVNEETFRSLFGKSKEDLGTQVD